MQVIEKESFAFFYGLTYQFIKIKNFCIKHLTQKKKKQYIFSFSLKHVDAKSKVLKTVLLMFLKSNKNLTHRYFPDQTEVKLVMHFCSKKCRQMF